MPISASNCHDNPIPIIPGDSKPLQVFPVNNIPVLVYNLTSW